jgi:ribonuclease P protein component
LSYPGAARKGVSVSHSDRGGADRTFPRASRLCSRRLFLEIYERGQRASSQFFAVFGLPGVTDRSRLGITATKKFGHAVARNRIKRQVREIFRNHRAAAERPMDVVVNVKAAAREQDYARLQADLIARFADLRRKIKA